MSTGDLTSIPLPLEPSSAASQVSHEVLEKAVKDSKSSSSKKPEIRPLACIRSAALPEPKMNTVESSQSLVDELFKDFIAQKFNGTSRDAAWTGKEGPISNSRNSADEMNKILDMEIKSIRSKTESMDKLKPQGTIDSTSALSAASDNSKLVKSEIRLMDRHTQISFPNTGVPQPAFVTSTSSGNPSKLPVTSTLANPKKLPETVSSAGLTITCPASRDSYHQTVVTGTLPAVLCGSATDPHQLAELKEQNPVQALLPVTNATIKKNIMLPTALAKKMMPPKLLGVKLSTESLSLIQSTDRIDRNGRILEEGEVRSSSEDSDEDTSKSDSEPGGIKSESGSISSEGWKTRMSKHKKKHKHKHKKKHKKSEKNKDRHEMARVQEDDTNNGIVENNKDICKEGDRKSENKARRSKEKEIQGEDLKDEKKHTLDQSKGDKENCSQDKEKKADNKLDGIMKGEKLTESKRKRSHSRSRSPKKHRRSKSTSHSHSKKQERNSSAGSSHYSEWDARRYSNHPSKYSDRERSRSRSSERLKHDHHRGKVGSHKRSRSRDKKDVDLRLQIDKAKLRKIAIANALQNMKAGQGPQVDFTVLKSGGKSVEELTEFCKKISEKSQADADGSSNEEEAKASDDDELLIHHPFKVKDTSSIVMNIRNAKQLPIMTPSEKQAQQATLRLTFPVSSGSHHRASESEWVPVVKTPPVPIINSSQVAVHVPDCQTKPDSIFPDQAEAQKIDIGTIISERLQAVRKLQENPYDVQALSKMHHVQEQASKWAASKHLPGQFLGSTGAQVLSQEELIGDRRHQAWAKKTQLSQAAPVSGGIGMFLLQKMGWRQGEGLGKNSEGSKEPLMLDVKVDRRGLATATDNRNNPQIASVPRAKDLSNKHPVSALMELCNRRKWGPPLFTVVAESGPDHKKNFLFKVKVNNVEYQPAMPSSNKKVAKAQCAAVCLQNMGLIPRDAPLNI